MMGLISFYPQQYNTIYIRIADEKHNVVLEFSYLFS